MQNDKMQTIARETMRRREVGRLSRSSDFSNRKQTSGQMTLTARGYKIIII